MKIIIVLLLFNAYRLLVNGDFFHFFREFKVLQVHLDPLE